MLSRATLPFRVLFARFAQERGCRWTRAQLETHQRRSVERLRRFAYARSPFYRRFHAGLEHAPLHELPILTKAELMANFDDLVTDRRLRLADIEAFLHLDPLPLDYRGYVVLATSGSTGRRGVFVFSPREWIAALGAITRPMAWAGVRQSPLRPRRMAMVASTVPWHYSARVGQSLATPLIPSLRLDAAEPLESIVRQLQAWQPEILAAYPSLLRQLAEEQLAGRMHVPLRDIATSAEVLPAETRRRVEAAWGVRVHDTYGATEYAPIAAECAYYRKHLVEDGALIEIVDERGRAVPAGTAGDRVLLTVFDRFTQPLIRYEISDMVRPLAGACECGRPFRIVEGVEGRLEDVLTFPALKAGEQPVAVHPNLFHDTLGTVPAAGWQVLQEDDGLRIGFIGLPQSVLPTELERLVRERLDALGAFVSDVRVERVDALRKGATGKAPLVARRGAAVATTPGVPAPAETPG